MIDPTSTRITDLEVLGDPSQLYTAVANHGGVVWNSAHKSWLVGKHDYVRELLKNTDASSDRMTPFVQHAAGPVREKLDVMLEIMDHWVVLTDPPAHARLRKVIQRGFMPRRIAAIEDQVRATVVELMDEFSESGELDFMEDFAYRLPAIVISDLFNLPRSDVSRIKEWSDGISKFVLGSPSQGDRYDVAFDHMIEMRDYFAGIVDSCDPSAGDSLLHELVASRDEPEGLTRDEIISTLVLILFAGHETTANLLANSMLTLIQHPDRLAELVSGEATLHTAVEELLRYEGPVPVVVRVAHTDISIGGQTIRNGDRIFLLLHAANRDEDQFDRPSVIDFSRGRTSHLQFGFGPHLCVGAPLARLEGKVVFEEFLNRYQGFELIEDTIDWRDELMTRGPRSLPIRLTRR